MVKLLLAAEIRYSRANMRIALIAMGVLTLVELSMWLPGVWRLRKYLAVGLVIGLSVAGSALVGVRPSFATLILLLITAYRIINLLRIMDGRMEPHYLWRAASRASLYMIGFQIFIALSWYICEYYHLHSYEFWMGVTIFQLGCAAVFFLSNERHLRTTRPLMPENPLTNKELPSLTVAIPARNETEDLDGCLASLVESTYPKLEILVLDDCSQNKRTPEIIRSFAQAGVRFLAGQPTKENWLAKNYAYQQLLQNASGELILFCGVDVRFEPDSLRRMVESMLAKKKSMVSLIPRNTIPTEKNQWEAYLLQPARYAWELILPRKLFRRPPVLSTCWLIKRSTLESAGGFAAVSRSIVPESYFAKVSAHHDGYSFMQSTPAMDITSHKPVNQQRATTLRMRYPQLHRRTELALIMTLAETLVLVLPFIFFITSFITAQRWTSVISGLTSLLILLTYARVLWLTYRRVLWFGMLLAPFAAIQDIVLLNYSMAKYEFSEVYWKERNVCIPVMRVIPELPKV